MKNIFEGIADVLHGNGVSEADICDAEKKLGVQFAEDYRKYLSDYGIAAANGHELTGITRSSRVNVVYVTENERKVCDLQDIHNMYVVEQAGIDGIIIWQSSDGKIWETVPYGKLKFVCDGLADLLKI